MQICIVAFGHQTFNISYFFLDKGNISQIFVRSSNKQLFQWNAANGGQKWSR